MPAHPVPSISTVMPLCSLAPARVALPAIAPRAILSAIVPTSASSPASTRTTVSAVPKPAITATSGCVPAGTPGTLKLPSAAETSL